MDASDREAAQAVIDKINALGDPDKVTLKQEEAVKEAREAYDALTKGAAGARWQGQSGKAGESRGPH